MIEVVDPVLEGRVLASVEAIERRLREAFETDQRFVAEASAHLADAGGKRFRPLILALAAEFGTPDERVVDAGAVVELTHLATLYHDDVMDEAALRRGAPSANARWTNSIAILVGDYLFAQASRIVAGLGPEAVRIQAETFSRLVTGQIRETIGPEDGVDELRHYLQVVADKTGSLIATSARFGATMSGAGEHAGVLTEFGERIGTAFQLSDDLLDVLSRTSGKTPGTDLREGIPTLPTLFVRRSTDPADADLRRTLSAPVPADEVDDVLARLRRHPAVEEARRYVAGECETARSMLGELPDVPARSALDTLCETLATRLA